MRNKKFIEYYRGFGIYKSGDDLKIYKGSQFVKRIESCLTVSVARQKIDEIIKNNR